MSDALTHTALLQGIIDASDAAVIAEDLNGSIILWNASAEHLFGFAAAEAIGQPVSIIVPPEKSDEARHVDDDARRGERSEHSVTSRIAKDGTPRDVSLIVLPVRDGDGPVVSIAHVMRDVSERRHLERQALHLAALVQSSDDA